MLGKMDMTDAPTHSKHVDADEDFVLSAAIRSECNTHRTRPETSAQSVSWMAVADRRAMDGRKMKLRLNNTINFLYDCSHCKKYLNIKRGQYLYKYDVKKYIQIMCSIDEFNVIFMTFMLKICTTI